MKCPHCTQKIGLFSKVLNNFEKTKHCPNCSKEVKVFINLKITAILFIPFMAISLLIVKPIFIAFGLSSSITTGLLCGFLIAFSSRLKSVN